MAKRSTGSELFELAGKAGRRYATRKFQQTGVGRAIKTAQRAMRKGGIDSRKLERKIRDKRADKVIESVKRAGGPTKYSQKESSALDDLYDALGPFGDVLRAIFGSTAGRSSQEIDDVYDSAVEVVNAFGGEVLNPKRAKGFDRGIAAAKKLLEESGLMPDQDDRNTPIDAEIIIPTEIEPGTGRAIEEPPLPGETSLSPELRTPTSSNVYSFQYDYSSSTMYVRYQAPMLNPNATKNKKGRGGLRSIKGELGKTIIGRRNEPGPLYAYYDVPVRVFTRLSTASSAGKSVWDNLRQRGSLWGHKFRYSLIQGAVVPGESGNISTYIPRRVTRRGFKSRTVAEVGQGRRRFQTSGLPERSFPDRAGPNRGTPDRGSPNRG